RWTAVLLMSSSGSSSGSSSSFSSGSSARPLTPALRDDLARAAAELEAIGEDARAADAYAILGDVEGRARALARAGDVEALEAFLSVQQQRDREASAQRAAQGQFDLCIASGQRREALAVAAACSDESLLERARSIESRRVAGAVVGLTIRGKETLL